MLQRRIVPAVGVLMILGATLWAQKPAENVSAKRHPNLAAAQRLVEQAFNKISDAQQANEWDMNGHAQKAKQLLDQANAELKSAAESANRR
jgi:F0F1-type ATP synthase membrane subunit b/b'